MHRFPLEPEVRGAWIKFCARDLSWLPGPGARYSIFVFYVVN
jgi:hypothetical protein